MNRDRKFPRLACENQCCICSNPGRTNLELSQGLTLGQWPAGGTQLATPLTIMFSVLFIIAAVWVIGAGLFVAALAAAAKKMPPGSRTDVAAFEEAA